MAGQRGSGPAPVRVMGRGRQSGGAQRAGVIVTSTAAAATLWVDYRGLVLITVVVLVAAGVFTWQLAQPGQHDQKERAGLAREGLS